MWSLMFIHFRIRNPYLSSTDVNKLMLRSPNELSRMIRSYSIFVYEKMRAISDSYGIMIRELSDGTEVYVPTFNSIELTEEMARQMLNQ